MRRKDLNELLNTLRSVALLLGAALIVLGVGMIYVPAGLIVCGVLLVAAVVIDGYDDTGEGSDGTQ